MNFFQSEKFDRIRRALVVSCASRVLASTLMSQPVYAQAYLEPPEYKQVDVNRVDLLSGSTSLTVKLGSIGSGIGELEYSDVWPFTSNNLNNTLTFHFQERREQWTLTVGFANSSRTYKENANGSWSILRGGPSAGTVDVSGATYVHTLPDGEVRTYGIPAGQTDPFFLMLLTRTQPNGVVWQYDWQTYGIFARPLSVTNNLGYKITLSYLSNTNPDISNMNNVSDWGFVQTINFYNLALSLSPVSTASRSRTDGVQMITDGGQVWGVSGVGAEIDYGYPSPFYVKTPSAPSYNYSYTPISLLGNGTHRYTSAVVNGLTYSYDFNLTGNDGVTKVTDPTGAISEVRYTKYESFLSSAAVTTKIIDPLNRPLDYVNAFTYTIQSITRPEGDKDIFGYDIRGNLNLVTHKPKTGSTLADITQSAIFPASCTNIFTCNRPTSVTDGNGNTTAYEYAAAHGGVEKETLPADPSGINPVKRYSYAQRTAWIMNGSGGYMTAGTGVWLKTEERTCRTTATVGNACQGGSADEVVTAYDYGPNSGPNNLLLRGTSVTADGQTLRTCFTYDPKGNKLSETKPLGTGSSCP